MDLGTAPLFDLSAPVVEQGVEPAVSRSDELLRDIRRDQAAIAEREVAKVRRIAEWASLHVVAEQADAATLTERGLDTGLPVAGDGAPLISDFAVMELAALLGRSLDSARSFTGEITRTVPGRKTELVLHLSAADQTVGRLGNTRTPISPEQVKAWLGSSGTP